MKRQKLKLDKDLDNEPARILERMQRMRGYLHESHKFLILNDHEFLTKYDQLFSYVMGRDSALPIRIKELLVIALLSAKGEYPALELHIKRALENGAAPLEILEALEVAMFYSGAPTIIYGIETLQKVLRDKGLVKTESAALSRHEKSVKA